MDERMQVAVYSTKPYDRQFLEAANAGHGHGLHFLKPGLDRVTAPLAKGFPAICAFVNDSLDAETLEILAQGGTRFIALRCAGFNQVDLSAAKRLGFQIARVPAYSPHAVAEHALALIMTLNRKTHRAHQRVREGNFSLDGLLGFDLRGKTVGVVGTGKIGAVFAKIMAGLECRVLAYDLYENDAVRKVATYCPLDQVFRDSDIVSLHCPLTPETRYLINRESISQMRRGAMLINTSRGALIETRALIEALKSGELGSVGLDVYEEESELFFEDYSNEIIRDDVFARLLTFPNVLVTGHQAFFTDTAMSRIAATTVENLTAFEKGNDSPNFVPLA